MRFASLLRSSIKAFCCLLLVSLCACGKDETRSKTVAVDNPSQPLTYAAMGVFVDNQSFTALQSGQANVAELDFGTHLLGTVLPAPITIVIRSEGISTLELSAPSLSDPAGGTFTLISTAFDTSVNPGGETRFGLAFSPSIAGSFNTTVSFENNADNTAQQRFELHFRGVAQGPGVGNPPPPAAAQLDLNVDGFAVNHRDDGKAVLIYADVLLYAGNQPASKTIRVTNNGNADCALTAASISGTGTSAFQLNPSSALPMTLMPTQSASFDLIFDPTLAGDYRVTFELMHDIALPAPNPMTLSFRGRASGVMEAPLFVPPVAGRTGEVVVLVDGVPVIDMASGSKPLLFGSARKAIRIANYKNNDITIDSIEGIERSLTDLQRTLYLVGVPALPLVLQAGAAVEFGMIPLGNASSEHQLLLQIEMQTPQAESFCAEFMHEAIIPPTPAPVQPVANIHVMERLPRGADQRELTSNESAQGLSFPRDLEVSTLYSLHYRVKTQAYNSLSADTPVDRIQVNGANASLFTAAPETGYALPASVNHLRDFAFRVEFSSSALGLISGSISIFYGPPSAQLEFVINIEALFVAQYTSDYDARVVTGNGVSAWGSSDSLFLDGERISNLSTPISTTFVVKNRTTATLTLPAPYVGSVNAQVDVSGVPSTLAPGQSFTVTVLTDVTTDAACGGGMSFLPPGYYVPGSPDYYRALLSLSANHALDWFDPAQPGSLAFQQSALSPGASIYSEQDFGSGISVGSATPERMFDVLNTGGQSLAIAQPTIKGPNAADFSVRTLQWGSAISGGERFTLAVSFTPQSGGRKSAWLEVEPAPAGSNPSASIRMDLAGYAINTGVADFEVLIETLDGDALASGATFTAPDRGISDGATEPYWFVLHNPGGLVMELGTPRISGSGLSAWELELEGFTFSVPARESVLVGARFNPMQLGTFDARITIPFANASRADFIINLSGSGVAINPRALASTIIWQGFEGFQQDYFPATNSVNQWLFADNTPMYSDTSTTGRSFLGPNCVLHTHGYTFGGGSYYVHDEWIEWADGDERLDRPNLQRLALSSTSRCFFTQNEIYFFGAPPMAEHSNPAPTSGFHVANITRGAIKPLGPPPPASILSTHFDMHETASGLLFSAKTIQAGVAGYFFDRASASWRTINAPSMLGDRRDASIGFSQGKLVVWGGVASTTNGMVNDGAVYDLASDSWSVMSTTGAPSARFESAGIVSGGKLLIFGGRGHLSIDTIYAEGGGVYDLLSDTWTSYSPLSCPTARTGYDWFVANDRAYIIGGTATVAASSNGRVFDFAAGTWIDPGNLGSSANWGDTRTVYRVPVK